MKKILAILRVSTDKQEIESQKLELGTFIKSKGFSEDEIEWLEAKGASARSLNDKYLVFLNDIKTIIKTTPSIKTIAMWSLNRLGRVESKLMEMKEFFVNNKIQVYSMTPSLTLFDENGEVSIGMSIAFSVYAALVAVETDEMFKKCDRGRRQTAKEGRYIGGYINFGYKVENKHIVIDQEEANLVRKVFTMYATGNMSAAKIAKELDGQGYTVRSRRDKTKRIRITMSTIAKMIRNQAYIGVKKTEKFEVKYPPIIEMDLWEKCRAVANKNNKTSDKSFKNYHLGNNIIQCPHCGYGYMFSHYIYDCYKHRMRHRFDGEDCTEHIPIKDTVIDPIIMGCAVDFANLYAQERQVESIQKYKATMDDLRKKIQHCEDLIESEFETKKKKLTEMYLEDKIGKQYYDAKMDEIQSMVKIEQTRIDEYKSEFTKLKQRVEDNDPMKQYELSQLKALGDCKERKEFVNTYIDKVWVFKDRIEVYPKFGKRMVITTPDYYYSGDELEYTIIECDERLKTYPTFVL